jgi:urease accessory protein
VRAGACLDLGDVAGTVAYSGRGVPAAWHVRATVADGATLRYAGEPFVVADGADVTRTLELDVATGAAVLLRDTVVLGRSGERGGRLRSRTAVRVGDTPVLREDQDLDPDRDRCAPGLLGCHRVLDTVLWLGPGLPPPVDAISYALVGGAGTLTRWLGGSLAESPLGRAWSPGSAGASPTPAPSVDPATTR